MNATEYTIDPKNEVAIRFLQSRPIQIGQTGFLVSVAQDLENRGSLSKGQREAIERIAAKSNWQPGPALPPTVDDRGELKIYCTPGHPIPKDFFKALGDRYRGSGLTGAVVVHDPVYMIMLDPAAMPLDAPYRLLTSRGVYQLTGTGWAGAGFKPRQAESADTLNDVVSPQLSTADQAFEFRNVKNKSGWWVFGERKLRVAAVEAEAPAG